MSWMATSEEGILMARDLYDLSDLLRPPDPRSDSVEFDRQIQQLLNRPPEGVRVAGQLAQICAQHENLAQQLGEYKLQALMELWKARERCLKAQRDQAKRSKGEENSRGQNGHEDLSLKLTLSLLFPMVESQSRLDPKLCKTTNDILRSLFRNRSPCSIVDNHGSLDGLEDLLVSWIREEDKDPERMQSLATNLVLLALGRNSIRTMVTTVKVLYEVTHRIFS